MCSRTIIVVEFATQRLRRFYAYYQQDLTIGSPYVGIFLIHGSFSTIEHKVSLRQYSCTCGVSKHQSVTLRRDSDYIHGRGQRTPFGQQICHCLSSAQFKWQNSYILNVTAIIMVSESHLQSSTFHYTYAHSWHQPFSYLLSDYNWMASIKDGRQDIDSPSASTDAAWSTGPLKWSLVPFNKIPG